MVHPDQQWSSLHVGQGCDILHEMEATGKQKAGFLCDLVSNEPALSGEVNLSVEPQYPPFQLDNPATVR